VRVALIVLCFLLLGLCNLEASFGGARFTPDHFEYLPVCYRQWHFTLTIRVVVRRCSFQRAAAAGNSARQTVTHTYDAAGIVHTVTDGLGNKTVTTCDAEGRPVVEQITDSEGGVVRQRTYDFSI
jgi:YD repeat-containing protein